MKHWSPIATVVAVLLGLVGFMTVNSVGGLVIAAETGQPPATTGTTTPTTLPTTPPATTTESTPAQPTDDPDDTAFPSEVVYAGFAEDGKLAVAVAVSGDQAATYLCDGVDVESWLTGTVRGRTISVESADGATRLTAELAGDGIEGTALLGGSELSFAIGVADPPAGLYRGEDGSTTIGWVVLPDGTQVGIATTGGRSAPAPRLDPAAGGVTVDGTRIDARKVTGAGF